MKSSHFILFILTVFLGTSCKAPAFLSKKANKNSSAEALVEHLVKNQVKAEWMYARAKVRYDDKYQGFGASATIQLRKDSVLWMNIKKFGLEVARVQITADSIYILDRINNEYYIEGIDYIEKSYNMPASFSTLQALILGNPVFFNRNELIAAHKELFVHLEGKGDRFDSRYVLDATGLLLRSMSFGEVQTDRKLDYELEDYRLTADKQNFSYIRKLDLDSQETGKSSLEIKLNKVEFDVPKSIRFEIPERYTKAD